jgi:hypothetical protein
MEILVFKTNIRYKKEINAIRAHMDAERNILKWNIDLKDVDKILRVESKDLHPVFIENLVQKTGHHCEELKD